MNNPKNIEKGKATKRANGTLNIWLGERGGNGKLTTPQIILACSLGWVTEFVICTGHHSYDGSGFPTNYKVDIANPVLKLAVEVDGLGHNSKKGKQLDKKKEGKLTSLGWKVLRVTNEEVMTNLSTVLLKIKKEIKAI